ncbi:MAG: DUF3089 domain-containing protein [Propionibacteriaceae bacterium]|jgi:pimeloyl-ACP methyl ester carboxylesterase|nr:DUF3089 domain-containing protein [Propionibacteriaceae bacterium]
MMKTKMRLAHLLPWLLLPALGLTACATTDPATTTSSAVSSAAAALLPPTGDDTITPTDYADPNNWVETGGTLDQPVDVFYLYTTAWERQSSDEQYYAELDNAIMREAAPRLHDQMTAVFDLSGNIFEPYYRQIDAIWMLGDLPRDQWDHYLSGLPYHDAVAAFDYYIEHLNNGRPFILAGHSQGSAVLRLLLLDYFDDHPEVYQRMVAAYVIGWSITQDDLDRHPYLKFATAADDTNVVVSYNTEAPGVTDPNPTVFDGARAINPISWTQTTDPVPATDNRPSRLFAADGTYQDVTAYADAQVDPDRGTVLCSTIDPAGNTVQLAPYLFPAGVYHGQDFELYWGSLEANASLRAATYVAMHR